jgi:16S rRNA (cytosine967-C5)-methyltransferase
MSHRRTNPALDAAKRIARQADLYSDVLYDLVRDVFASGKPADRVIGSMFRRNRSFGSNDRRFLNETYFAIFRWWGWLRYLPDGEAEFEFPAEGEGGPDAEAWIAILLGAHILDTDDLHPIASEWKRQVLPKISGREAYVDCVGSGDMAAKVAALRRAFPGCRVDANLLLPKWIDAELPKETPDDLADWLQRRPPLWLRGQRETSGNQLVRMLKESEIDGVTGTMRGAVSITSTRTNLYELDAFRKGLFEIQDAGSQCIGKVCQASRGERWWDACAGAGGKTLQLADAMENKGVVVATDIREWKLGDLKKRVKRARFSNVSARPWDGKKVRKSSFDGILVDAPCSCTGTWRRSPDAKWTSGVHDPKEMQVIQLQILKRVVPAVRPNGVLVYATCSMCKSENEDVVETFLKDNPAFQLEAFKHPATGELVESGCLRIWPGDLNSDAMFVARFRKKTVEKKAEAK